MSRIERDRRLPAVLAAALLLALPLGAATAAEDGERAQEEIAEAYDAVEDYSYEKKDDLVAWLERRREQLDRQAEALREKARTAGAEASERLTALAERLEAQREAAGRKLRRLGDASADAWDDLKRGALDAYEDLEKAYRDATADDEEA